MDLTVIAGLIVIINGGRNLSQLYRRGTCAHTRGVECGGTPAGGILGPRMKEVCTGANHGCMLTCLRAGVLVVQTWDTEDNRRILDGGMLLPPERVP